VNRFLGMATSAIWKATYRPWLTTFAPILSNFSFKLVSDQSSHGEVQVKGEIQSRISETPVAVGTKV
jgi:hypothetical protein